VYVVDVAIVVVVVYRPALYAGAAAGMGFLVQCLYYAILMASARCLRMLHTYVCSYCVQITGFAKKDVTTFFACSCCLQLYHIWQRF
jgi:hypothetical protein